MFLSKKAYVLSSAGAKKLIQLLEKYDFIIPPAYVLKKLMQQNGAVYAANPPIAIDHDDGDGSDKF